VSFMIFTAPVRNILEKFTKYTDAFCVQTANFVSVAEGSTQGVSRSGGDWCGCPRQQIQKGKNWAAK
jgi:hypothetical protein